MRYVNAGLPMAPFVADNMRWYTQPLTLDIFPLEQTLPKSLTPGFSVSNSSLLELGGKVYLNARMINYRVVGSSYQCDGAVRTRNVLAVLDRESLQVEQVVGAWGDAI